MHKARLDTPAQFFNQKLRSTCEKWKVIGFLLTAKAKQGCRTKQQEVVWKLQGEEKDARRSTAERDVCWGHAAPLQREMFAEDMGAHLGPTWCLISPSTCLHYTTNKRLQRVCTTLQLAVCHFESCGCLFVEICDSLIVGLCLSFVKTLC